MKNDSARPRKILVVDDEIMNIKLMEAKLTPWGYIVDGATRGAEAIEKARSKRPDLILLDVLLPDIDGYRVCETIRNDASLPYIPIIFITATQLDQNDVIRGLEIGGDDYVRKPFDTAELISRIRAALRVKELYDRLARMEEELAKYVSLNTLRLVKEISSGEKIEVGRTQNATVLFSDIRGFTNITEKMEPSEVFEILNFYLSRQIKIIEGHGGIIDKMSGDEIMAIFEGPRMAQNALTCGKVIIKTLRQHQEMKGGVGIGINTGKVYMGILGTESMRDYTVVGNAVNIAARLCGAASRFQVLFTENTKQFVEGEEFEFRSIGKILLKGLSSPTETFELII